MVVNIEFEFETLYRWIFMDFKIILLQILRGVVIVNWSYITCYSNGGKGH